MIKVELLVIADDLSGAAEAAATCLVRTTRISVNLSSAADRPDDPDSARPEHSERVVVVDTDSRHASAHSAAKRVRAATRGVEAPLVVKKIDSLLRGNLVAELAAVRDILNVTPVVAPALPKAGRLVLDSVLHVRGVPLHRTTLWAAESASPPESVIEALSPLPVQSISQAVISAGVAEVARAFAAADSAGRIPVCDTSTDQDLDIILGAARMAWKQPVLLGSAALVAAAARTLSPDDDLSPRPEGPFGHVDDVVVVLGSVAGVIRDQVARISQVADAVITLDPERVLQEPELVAAEVSQAAREARLLVVILDPAAKVRPELSRNLARAFSEVVEASCAAAAALVLSGGETARSVLDRLGVTRLRPIADLHHGAVLSHTSTGQLVVTRPGSFGRPDSLVDIATSLLSTAPRLAKESS